MRVELSKEFSFEAAHRLPNAPPANKCSRLHGHSYRVALTVEGEVDPELGWFIDYQEIKLAFEPFLEQYLDHYYLNEIEGLANPTSENLAKWIWDRLKSRLSGLKRVSIFETCTSACHYEGK
jgi:6-pyruvoyltetrahydropterin/6-carboxytetrahydropterin synthase